MLTCKPVIQSFTHPCYNVKSSVSEAHKVLNSSHAQQSLVCIVWNGGGKMLSNPSVASVGGISESESWSFPTSSCSAYCLQRTLQVLVPKHYEGINCFPWLCLNKWSIWLLSIFSPIHADGKLAQKGKIPFPFPSHFNLILQSTPDQSLLPFVCSLLLSFLPVQPCQLLFSLVLNFLPSPLSHVFFLPQEIPSTVLAIIFECNNDITLYIHSELIKCVAAIGINNYELTGKKNRENPWGCFYTQ